MRKEGIEDVLRELGCTALAAKHSILNRQRITKIKEETETSLVYAWTIDDPKEALRLTHEGVNGIISDHLERFDLLKSQLHLLMRRFTLFKAFENSFLNENKHQDAKLQQEYDKRKRFSLTLE